MPAESHKSKVAQQATELYRELHLQGVAPKGLQQAPLAVTDALKKKRLQEDYKHLLKSDTPFRKNVRALVDSKLFHNVVMIVVLVNIILIAVENTIGNKEIFARLDIFFFIVYFIEFAMKFYVERKLYWVSHYNRLDFILIAINILQWIVQIVFPNLQVTYLYALRSLRALRALRSLSLLRSLQVIVNALVNTIKTSVLDIILLLLLVMFLSAVVGYHLMGEDPDRPTDFSTLGGGMLTLFVFVTADGWTDRQKDLEKAGYGFSKWFVMIFIFIGNFIFTNLFIAVICKNIDEATDNERKVQREKRLTAKKYKKDVFARKQKEELLRLMAHQREMQNANVQEVFQSLAGQLSHDDLVPMNHLSCNLRWLETYLVTLKYHESAMKRTRNIHYKIADTLAELADRKVQNQV